MPCEKQEVQILRKLNHFARVCRKNSPESAKHVTFEDTAENDEYVYTIGGDKQTNCKVKKTDGNDGQLRRIGRSHGRTLRELYKRKVPRATKRRIFSYGSSTLLPILATIEAEIFANSNSTWTTLHVINDIQETSWSWVQHCYKTCACSRSSTKSNLTRPVPSPPST